MTTKANDDALPRPEIRNLGPIITVHGHGFKVDDVIVHLEKDGVTKIGECVITSVLDEDRFTCDDTQ